MRTQDDPEHQTRDRLLERIRDRPGISFGELMTSLKMNEGTLRYHLNYLERRELVRSRKEGARRLYYMSILSPSTGDGTSDLSRDHKRVLTLIRRHPGIKNPDLLSSMDITPGDLNRIVRKLKSEHLIWEVENGNGIGYEVITRKRLIEEMLLDLVERFLKGEIDQTTFMRLKAWMEEEQQNT